MQSAAASPHTTAAQRLIVALDFPSAAEAFALVDRLEGQARWVKVGLQLYLAAGSQVVGALRDRGFEVFLDLKLHDIPNTVAGAVRSLAGCGASLLTVHGLGGPAMLAAAAAVPDAPRLLAVTVLTSMDSVQLDAIGITNAPAVEVSRLARLAIDAGLAGVICSPEECLPLRGELGAGPLLVVPGIRSAAEAVGDQRRVASATTALAAGASMLVVGRPITTAMDPAAVVARLLQEMASAL